MVKGVVNLVVIEECCVIIIGVFYRIGISFEKLFYL